MFVTKSFLCLLIDNLWFAFKMRAYSCQCEQIVAESVDVLVCMIVNLLVLKKRDQVALSSSANSTSYIQNQSLVTYQCADWTLRGPRWEE